MGARFTIAGETLVAGPDGNVNVAPVHTVTSRTFVSMSTTVVASIVFAPALGAGTYTKTAAVTFLPQQLNIKVGDGDLKWTENDNFKYDLDRGILDGVRLGDDAPMDVDFNFAFEHITTGTNEPISPMDALKAVGAAAEWVSAASDKCEPFAVDVIVTNSPNCNVDFWEIIEFPEFRSDKREASIKDANIAITGKCNATEPIITRPYTA